MEHEIARNCSADVTLEEASCKKMFVNPDKVAIASTRSIRKSKIILNNCLIIISLIKEERIA